MSFCIDTELYIYSDNKTGLKRLYDFVNSESNHFECEIEALDFKSENELYIWFNSCTIEIIKEEFEEIIFNFLENWKCIYYESNFEEMVFTTNNPDFVGRYYFYDTSTATSHFDITEEELINELQKILHSNKNDLEYLINQLQTTENFEGSYVVKWDYEEY